MQEASSFKANQISGPHPSSKKSSFATEGDYYRKLQPIKMKRWSQFR
ncbi:rCG62918 [Rattus norvegicus]|uniref:RCG62918 n=1 Tax=Rattus norvegicus TaxID=10116 RepID=A6I2E6_RAT|nr:rCG62918 [Rattus norvegicus]